MKIIFGADIIISVDKSTNEFASIGWLFQWLDKLKITKCIDFPTCAALSHFCNLRKQLQKSFEVIPKVYKKNLLHKAIIDNYLISNKDYLKTFQYINTDALIAQLAVLEAGDADFLITDNPSLHYLARQLKIDDRVYYVSEFVNKCAIENREVDQSKGLILKETKLSQLNINDSFFDTFKIDYPDYSEWFKKKSDDKVFVSKKGERVIALLKLKIEDKPSDFNDVKPQFIPKKLLKISSFKIEPNRTKLAERFFRIIFNVASSEKIDGIYVTFFENTEQKRRLRRLFEKWGFLLWGKKDNTSELVLFRDFKKNISFDNPQSTFPYHSGDKGIYLVSINSTYANALLGLDAKSNNLYDVEPYKNSISKILITYNLKADIKQGSLILFVSNYQDKKNIVGVGIIQDVHRDIKDESSFLRICRKRSIFNDNRLKICWNKHSEQKTISTIEFLYVTQFESNAFSKNNINLLGINLNSLPEQEPLEISEDLFYNLIKGTQYEHDYIVHKT